MPGSGTYCHTRRADLGSCGAPLLANPLAKPTCGHGVYDADMSSESQIFPPRAAIMRKFWRAFAVGSATTVGRGCTRSSCRSNAGLAQVADWLGGSRIARPLQRQVVRRCGVPSEGEGHLPPDVRRPRATRTGHGRVHQVDAQVLIGARRTRARLADVRCPHIGRLGVFPSAGQNWAVVPES